MSDSTSFPQNVMRYSALRHLQKKVTEKCSQLPSEFSSLEAWESFRVQLIQGLKEKLPLWDTGTPRESVRTAELDLGQDLVLEAVDVHFEDEFYIPVHVYRKKDQAGRRPAVLVCPGYGFSKIAQDTADMCIALAKAGFVALAMEYDGTGERAERPDFETAINNVTAAAAMLGITNVGLRVMNNLAAVKYLKTRDEVDPARLGITGLCQGAVATWFTTAVCEELAAAAPLCGATTYEAIILEYCNRQGGWSGISPYVYGLFNLADVQHVVAAIAPRPLLVQNNIIDIHWPYSGFEKVSRFTQNIYGLYGKSDRCTFRIENGPHAFAEPFVTGITEWFVKVL